MNTMPTYYNEKGCEVTVASHWKRLALISCWVGSALASVSTSAQNFSSANFDNIKTGCYTPLDSMPQDIAMELGNIVIQPDTEPGSIIASKQFRINSQGKEGYCKGAGSSTIGILPQNRNLSELGNYIYKTNVPGIGLRLYREGRTIKTYYPHTLPSSDRHGDKLVPFVLEPGYFTVEVIRLPGPSGSGPLNPGLYSSYYADQTGPSHPFLTSHIYGNSITVVNSTCSIMPDSHDVTVDLGEAIARNFSGVGSTQNEKEFHIRLDCVGGNESQWSQKRGNVSLSFSYNADRRWGNQGVIFPETGGQGTARGVGIQLLNGAGTAVKDNDNVFAGQLSPSYKTMLDIPMKARFYQTEKDIRAGNISALATFTVVYE